MGSAAWRSLVEVSAVEPASYRWLLVALAGAVLAPATDRRASYQDAGLRAQTTSVTTNAARYLSLLGL